MLDLPASAVDSFPPQGSQLTTSVVSSCPMYFFPNAAGVSNTSATMPHGSVAAAETSHQQVSDGDVANSMEWYSGDSSRPPPRTMADGPRIDILDPAELVDLAGLLPTSSGSTDLGNIDMTDWLDDMLQPGCSMSADFLNLTADCEMCSSTNGVRATFEKVMEVTTSKS